MPAAKISYKDRISDRRIAGKQSFSESSSEVARMNFSRYEYVSQRGHAGWCAEALRFEDYYHGGGRQILPEDREKMMDASKMPIEINELSDAVNTALGYQINNRADISFMPRGQGASDEIATVLSKVAMQIADNNKLRWKESGVFADGMIRSRGFFEVMVNFDDSMRGEVRIAHLDSMDVIPDPDSKSYDPDGWADVVVTRWLTLDEIEGMWGTDVRKRIESNAGPYINEGDFGTETQDVPRLKFADDDDDTVYDAYYSEGGITRIRVIDRQYWKMVNTRVVVFPTGDIRVAENAAPEKIAAWRNMGCVILNRPTKRVRWTVSTCDTLIHDDWSPMAHFSIVPYFPFFRHGRSKGLLNDGIGPQDLLNSCITAYNHAVKATANSGWLIEQHSLSNMDTDDLDTEGAKPGLTIEYKRSAKNRPEKIQPNTVPTGIADLAKIASDKVMKLTGQTSAMRGEGGKDQSGIAIQSMQYAAQMSLTVPLDNLAQTRTMLAQRILELVQTFYDEPRVIRITTQDPITGKETSEELRINWQDAQGQVMHNVTIGEYDVVITEQPTQITFQNSQFSQALDMRKAGIGIPDTVLVKNSMLANKAEIIESMSAQKQTNPLDEAKAVLMAAQAEVAKATAIAKNVETLFSAIRTSQIAATNPGISAIADEIAKSSGFVDKNTGPIYPDVVGAPAAGEVQPPPNSTNPMTPDNPAVGMSAGIENGTTTVGA